MKQTLMILGFAALLVLGGAVYYGYSSKPAQPQNSQVIESPALLADSTPTPSVEATMTITETSVREFTIIGGNFKFTPNAMNVKKGDTVKVTFINEEGTHDFVLDEFQVRTKQIAAGQEESVQFVADKVGSFEFYCSVGKHRQMGMKGTLEVTE